MVDPSVLNAGALAVFGREKMELFGEIMPAPEERVICVNDGDAIDLGGRKLTVWDTPGHSKHHVCYHDDKTSGLFSGDIAGSFSPSLSQLLQRPVVRAATPGPDFYGDLMLKSLLRIALSEVDKIYYTHFGVGKPPRLLIEIVLGQLAVLMELGRLCKERSSENRGGQKQDGLEMLTVEAERYIRESLLGQDRFLDQADSRTVNEWDFALGTSMLTVSMAGIWQHLNKKTD
jgi:glyoxylase-like metal-dependent hydrolase (beta-lactamase superfamily II)